MTIASNEDISTMAPIADIFAVASSFKAPVRDNSTLLFEQFHSAPWAYTIYPSFSTIQEKLGQG